MSYIGTPQPVHYPTLGDLLRMKQMVETTNGSKPSAVGGPSDGSGSGSDAGLLERAESWIGSQFGTDDGAASNFAFGSAPLQRAGNVTPPSAPSTPSVGGVQSATAPLLLAQLLKQAPVGVGGQ